MKAVASGECSVGFALIASLGERYPKVERFYDCTSSGGGKIFYSAAALANATEPGVVRDFFEFINMCSD